MLDRGPKVVVIGGTYVDMALRCPHFPSAGQSLVGSALCYGPAGPGPLQAAEAVLCGCQVHLISKVGGDSFGSMVTTHLIDLGIHTDFVYTAEALHTGVVVTLVNPQGENAVCRYLGANTALQARDIENAEQVISEASVCLIHGEIPHEAITEAICIAQVHGTKVVLNPARPLEHRGRSGGDLPIEYFSADCLIPNLYEAAEITEAAAGSLANVHSAKLVGSELIARGVRHAVITMGRRGCVLVDRTGAEHIPAFEVDTVDHSGRGDAFAGALAAYLAVEGDVKRAVEFASAAGALACTKFGSIESMPTKAEIIQLLQRKG